MGHQEVTTQDLANVAAATAEAGGTVRWNHFKTVVLLIVSFNDYVLVVKWILTKLTGSP